MGRLGISFSDESGKGFKIDNRKHYATITSDDDPGNGLFQRCLAWLSYIVMVLTAFVTFNSTAQAGVTDHVRLVEREYSVVSMPSPVEPPVENEWILRPTR